MLEVAYRYQTDDKIGLRNPLTYDISKRVGPTTSFVHPGYINLVTAVVH